MLGVSTGTLTSKFFYYLSSTQATYVALHTGVPSIASPGSSEIGTRQRVYWTVSNNVASNTNDLTYVGLTTSNISYITVNDSLTGGNVLFTIPLLEPYALTAVGATGIYTLKADTVFLNFEAIDSVYSISGGTPVSGLEYFVDGGTP